MYSYVCMQDESVFINSPSAENRRGGGYGFYFKARVRYHRENPDDVEVLLSDDSMTYFASRDEFLSGNNEEAKRINLFAVLLAPFLPRSFLESIGNELILLAHIMVKDPKNEGRKILPIAVDVVIRSEAQAIARARFLEEVDRSLRASMDRADAAWDRIDRAIVAAGASRDKEAMRRVMTEVLQEEGYLPDTVSATETVEECRNRLAIQAFHMNMNYY